MRYSIIIVLSLLFSASIFTACEQQTKTEKATEELEEMGDAFSDIFQSEEQQLKNDLMELRNDIDDEMDKLGNNLADASEDMKTETNIQIRKLRNQRDKINRDLERIGNNMEEGWITFKENVNETIEDVREDLNS